MSTDRLRTCRPSPIRLTRHLALVFTLGAPPFDAVAQSSDTVTISDPAEVADGDGLKIGPVGRELPPVSTGHLGMIMEAWGQP